MSEKMKLSMYGIVRGFLMVTHLMMPSLCPHLKVACICPALPETCTKHMFFVLMLNDII
jgi:hypothetical protein